MDNVKTVISAHAPYNFVPFAESPLIRYDCIDSLPPHNCVNPELLSGEIRVKIQAKTPIFVGGGYVKGQPGQFFKTPGGKTAIPGSTVRGLVRGNMQILSFGLVIPGRDLDDYQIYFREISAASTGIRAKIKKVYTQDILDVDYSGKVTLPRKVKAGYLCREKGRYLIYPTALPLMIERTDPRVVALSKSPDDLRREPPHTENVVYMNDGDKITELLPLNNGDMAPEGMKKGILMFTGRPVGKPNKIYVFEELDKHACSPLIIPDEDVLSYQIDFEARRNVLNATQGKFASDFWALPTQGKAKPVFYVEHNGHIYFGMSRYPRVGYPYPLSTGLPPKHTELWQNTQSPLDYTRSLFGFTDSLGSCYASRISFSDFVAVGEPTVLEPVSMPLLGAKLSYYPGYTKGGEPYISDSFRLRGFKQYWLKSHIDRSASKSTRVGTSFCPLDADTEFEGVIRYKNLHPDELGLLLLSIRLKEGCYHSIGMGKPYGYGRILMSVSRLNEFDINALYDNFAVAPSKEVPNAVDGYIGSYCDELEKRGYSTDNDVWNDFFTMKSHLYSDDKRAQYMALSDYRKVRTPLPTVNEVVKSERVELYDVPSVDLINRLERGMILKGTVKNITDFGAFVDIGVGRNGLVHNNEISDPEPQNAAAVLSIGQEVTVSVISVNFDKLKNKYNIALSIKRAIT